MWNAESIPLPPQEAPGTHHPFRPSDTEDELEQLRRKGLAKLLNKHFSDSIKKVAKEKAEADAALRELYLRKAAASSKEFGASPSHLSQLDALYMELEKKRAQCRRKEKETLLLYQRYVHKFGNTGEVTVPSSSACLSVATSTSVSSNASQTPLVEAASASLLNPSKAKQAQRMEELPHVVSDSTDAPQSPAETSRSVGDQSSSQSNNSSQQWSKRCHDPPASIAPGQGQDPEGDDRSVISGLTSAEVMNEAESRLVEFIETETEAVRKILDLEEQTIASQGNFSQMDESSSSRHAARQAEAMVVQMKEMLDDYEQAQTATQEPRRIETSNPNEIWMAYYDETYKREYYHEVNSNRTQWEVPGSNDNPKKDTLSHRDVMPEDWRVQRRASRIQLYRRKRRRTRNRRIAALVFVAAAYTAFCMLSSQDPPHVAAFDKLSQARDKISSMTASEMMDEAKQSTKNIVSAVSDWKGEVSKMSAREILDVAQQSTARAAVVANQQFEVAKERASEYVERFLVNVSSAKRAEKERLRLEEEEARRRTQEQERKRLEEERRRAEELRVKQLEEERKRKELEELEALRLAEEEATRKRPWGCNIPLAYAVHGGCRRLSREKPVAVNALVTAMMQ